MDRDGKGPITRREFWWRRNSRYPLEWTGLSATFSAATSTQTLQHKELLGPSEAQIPAKLIPNGVCFPQRSLSQLSVIVSSTKLSISPTQREMPAFFLLCCDATFNVYSCAHTHLIYFYASISPHRPMNTLRVGAVVGLCTAHSQHSVHLS